MNMLQTVALIHFMECVCVYLLVCDCTYLFIYFVEGRCGGWVGVLQDEILEASRKVFDVEIPHRVVYIKKSSAPEISQILVLNFKPLSQRCFRRNRNVFVFIINLVPKLKQTAKESKSKLVLCETKHFNVLLICPIKLLQGFLKSL